MLQQSAPPGAGPPSPSSEGGAAGPPLPTAPPSAPTPASPPSPPSESALLSLPLHEFRQLCSTLVKRLHEASPDIQPELRRVLELLRLCAGWGDSEHGRLFLREWAVQTVEAVLRRHYIPDAGDCDVVVEVVQAALSLVCHHLTVTTPQPAPPLPPLTAFPAHTFDAPQPPPPMQGGGLLAFPALSFTGAAAGTHGLTGLVGSTSSGTGAASLSSSPVSTSPSSHLTFATAATTAVADSSSAASSLLSSSAPASAPDPGTALAPVVESSGVEEAAEAAASSSSTSDPSAAPLSLSQPSAAPDAASTLLSAIGDPPPAATQSAAAPTAASATLPTTAADPTAAVLSDAAPPPVPSASTAVPLSYTAPLPSSVQASPASSKSSTQPGTPGLVLSRTMTPSTSLLHARTPAPPSAYSSFLPVLHTLYPLPARAAVAPSRLSLDPVFLDLLELLLNDSHFFYTQYGHERPLPKLPNDVVDTPEWRAFNDALVPGDWVDVHVHGRWRPGLFMQQSHSKREVVFEGPATHESHNNQRREWLDRSVPIYAKAFSRSRFPLPPAQQWRYALQVGGSLDALDTVQKYYTAKVLELRGDYVRISYDGWTSKYDESLSLYSDRLAPHRSKALGGKESSGVSAASVDRGLDDSQDALFPHELVRWRGKEAGTWYWCEAVDQFARLGGFPLLFHRVYCRAVAPLPIAQLRRIVAAVSYCHLVMSRPLACHFLPLFHYLTFCTLLDLTDVELRQLSKEWLEEIVKSVTRLLTRLFYARQVQAYVDDFSLACAVKRLRCSVVERRINGMAFIQDYIALLKRFPTLSSSLSPTSTTWLTAQQVLTYIEREHILEDALSVTSGHHELMKRSTDILKLFASENCLENRHLDLIWRAMTWAMKRDDELQLQTLYKTLDDLAWQLSSSHILYLFSLVESIPFAEYQLATLDLIRELQKWTTAKTGGAAAKRATALLWACMKDGQGVSRDIAKAALGRIEELVKGRAYRLEYLDQFGTMLQAKVNVITCIHLLTQIIDSFPDQATPLEDKTRSTIIVYLNDHYHLIDSFIDDLAAFKLHAQQVLQAQHVAPSAINGTFISSFTSFLSHIKERLTFLLYILTHAQGAVALTQQHMDALWLQLNVNAYTAAEREQLFRFLRSCVQKTHLRVLSEALALHAFDALLLPSTNAHAQALTLPHYTAFEAFFFHVNYMHRKVNGSGVDDLTVTSPDFSLYGVDCLWRIAIECRVPSVSAKAIALLNALHENVSEEVSSALYVRSMYISRCMQHLTAYLNDHDWKRGVRCLQLLHNLLDNNDRKGVGTTRSHACATRGRRLRFVVQNNVKAKDGKRARVDVVAHANDTLFALRQTIASALALPVDSFRLITHGKPLIPDHYPLHLHQLPLRSGQTILVTRRSSPLSKADLLDGRGDPTPLFKAALTWIFGRFAGHHDEHGPFLSGSDFATYILACGAGEPSAGEERIRQIFERHGEKVEVHSEGNADTHPEEVKELAADERGPSVHELDTDKEKAVWEEFITDAPTKGPIGLWQEPLALPARAKATDSGRVEEEARTEREEEEEEDEEAGKENRPLTAEGGTKKIAPAAHVNGQVLDHVGPSHDAAASTTESSRPSSDSTTDKPADKADALSALQPAAVAKDTKERGDNGAALEPVEGRSGAASWEDELEDSALRPLQTHLLFVFDPVFNGPHSAHLLPSAEVAHFIDLPLWQSALDVHHWEGFAPFMSFLSALLAGDLSLINAPLVTIDWERLDSELAQIQRPVHSAGQAEYLATTDMRRLVHVVMRVKRRFAENGHQDVQPALQPPSPESVSSTSPTLSFSPSASPSPELNPSSPSPVPALSTSPRYELILRLSGFVDFYREACVDRVEAVWNDLQCHGFRHDLRRDEAFTADDSTSVDEVARAAQEAALPRNLIANHPQYFALLFQILVMSEREGGTELDELAASTWNLLQRLSTQPALHEALLTLKPAPVDWEELLSTQSLYRLLYSLQVLEGLTEALEDDEDEDERRRKQAQRDEWVDAFLTQGGFTHVFNILCLNPRLQTVGRVQEADSAFVLRQKCLGLLLRLLYHLLLSAMRVQKPELGGVVRLTPQPAEDFITASELEEEAKWSKEEAERESKEEEANGPTFLSYMHGPRQEHELDRREERKEREQKTNADRAKDTAHTVAPRERSRVSVEEDDGSDGEEQAVSNRTSSSDTALLGCHMTVAQSSSILSSVDLAALHLRLYHYVLGCARQFAFPITADGLAVAEPSLNTFIHLILFSPATLLPAFYALLTEAPSSFFTVLYCSSSKLRRLFAHAMYQIGLYTPVDALSGGLQPKPFLLSFLLNNFPVQVPSAPQVECGEYFELLNALIVDQIHEDVETTASSLVSTSLSSSLSGASQTTPSSPTSSPSSDSSASSSSSQSSSSTSPVLWQLPLPALFHLLCHRLLHYASVETESSSADTLVQDKVLCGILGLLQLLAHHRPDLRAEAARPLLTTSDPDLISLLFSWYLFGSPPRCRHPTTRGLTLSLLVSLCDQPGNFDLLFEHLCRQFGSLSHLQVLDYNPEKLVRSQAGHVGLRNLGSTVSTQRQRRTVLSPLALHGCARVRD